MPTVTKPGMPKNLNSWYQMMTVLRSTGASLRQLCSSDCLGGLHSPVRMPHVELEVQRQAVEYLIFSFFKKVVVP